MYKPCTGGPEADPEPVNRDVLTLARAAAAQGGARKAEVCSLASAVAIESAGSDAGARRLGSMGSTDSTAEGEEG